LVDRPLNQPAQHSISPQQTIPAAMRDSPEEGVTEVFYVGSAGTVQSFQDLATTLRTITQLRRVFTYNAAQAIAVRGTASQLAMAEWLFNELDRPASASTAGAAEFRATGPDDIVRVFSLAHGASGQDVQTIVPQIRAATSAQRALSYAGRGLLILRGTAAQMAAAEHLVQELDKP
jgi:type II secretory pathway component GspD/PulD (secretin)